MKLRAAGVETPTGASALDPRIGASEPSFEACLAGVRDGRVLRFSYRTSGRPGDEAREVEPWGVVSWKGRWYLVGHDRVRSATRVFRLSRIVGEVTPDGPPGAVVRPEGLDLRGMVVRQEGDSTSTTARVRIRQGSCWELRRGASSVEPAGDGWEVVEVGYGDPGRFADRVTGYGADAVVESPPEAREAVVRRLTALAGRGSV
jgi:proteasome accessory factor B